MGDDLDTRVCVTATSTPARTKRRLLKAGARWSSLDDILMPRERLGTTRNTVRVKQGPEDTVKLFPGMPAFVDLQKSSRRHRQEYRGHDYGDGAFMDLVGNIGS
jgi:hypothetical protein